jgi:hypothetical protein
VRGRRELLERRALIRPMPVSIEPLAGASTAGSRRLTCGKPQAQSAMERPIQMFFESRQGPIGSWQQGTLAQCRGILPASSRSTPGLVLVPCGISIGEHRGAYDRVAEFGLRNQAWWLPWIGMPRVESQAIEKDTIPKPGGLG